MLQNLLVQQILNSHKQLCVLFKTFALLKCWLISAVLLSNLRPAENILWCCFPPASFEVVRKCRDETRYCKMQFRWILPDPWKGHCLWAQGRWKRLGTVSGTVCKQYPKHQTPKSQLRNDSGGSPSPTYSRCPKAKWFCLNVCVNFLCALGHTKEEIDF